MTRQAELDDLRDQAVRHALIAERMGFVATAEALWTVAREAGEEQQGMSRAGWRGLADGGATPWRSDLRPRVAAEL